MLYSKELPICSFFQGKSLRLITSFSAYLPASFPFPTNPWPPSLVPTWKTTAWSGVCFSHAKKGASGSMQGHKASQGNISLFHRVNHRETNLIDAKARAPP